MNRPQIIATPAGRIHVTTCKYATSAAAVPLEVTDSGDLARQTTFTGLQQCLHCKPIARLATYERQQRGVARP